MKAAARLEAIVELREYMSVRRAYNLVRQETESSYRLTFEEFAILESFFSRYFKKAIKDFLYGNDSLIFSADALAAVGKLQRAGVVFV